MDLQMPELDGYRATQSIKKMAASSGRSIPILAMTASAYVISSDKASMFSMDDYIGKPFDRNVLLGKAIGLISRTVQA
ncbi:MAG: response regulator [Saprospiraceae bacterium]|nr:response regulator [Saprospiraceae bacterium]